MSGAIYLPQAVGGPQAFVNALAGLAGQAGGTAINNLNRQRVVQESQNLPPDQQAQYILRKLGPAGKDLVDNLVKSQQLKQEALRTDLEAKRTDSEITTNLLKQKQAQYVIEHQDEDHRLTVEEQKAKIRHENAMAAGTQANIATSAIERQIKEVELKQHKLLMESLLKAAVGDDSETTPAAGVPRVQNQSFQPGAGSSVQPGAQPLGTQGSAPLIQTGSISGQTDKGQEKAPDIAQIIKDTPDLGAPDLVPVLNKLLIPNYQPADTKDVDVRVQILNKDADRLDRMAKAYSDAADPKGLQFAEEADRRRKTAEEMKLKSREIKPLGDFSVPGTNDKVKAYIGQRPDGQREIIRVEDKRTVDKDLSTKEPTMAQFYATTKVLGEFADGRDSGKDESSAKQAVRKIGTYLQEKFGIDTPSLLDAPPDLAANVAAYQHNLLGVTALMPNASRSGYHLTKMFTDLAPSPGDSVKIQKAKVDASNLNLQILVKTRVESVLERGDKIPPNIAKIYDSFNLKDKSIDDLVTAYVDKVRKTGVDAPNPLDGNDSSLNLPGNEKSKSSPAKRSAPATDKSWSVEEVP